MFDWHLLLNFLDLRAFLNDSLLPFELSVAETLIGVCAVELFFEFYLGRLEVRFSVDPLRKIVLSFQRGKLRSEELLFQRIAW